MEPTFRYLRLGEAVPGQFVEHLGETVTATGWLGHSDGLLYPGHPGRVDKDYEDGLGGHVVVIWHGLEETDWSSTAVGQNPDAHGDYLGLGWLDATTHHARVDRLNRNELPLGD